MTLAIYTARMGYKLDQDWLDITRAQRTNQTDGGHRGIGLSFAPSIALLKHYLKLRSDDIDPGRELSGEEWERYSQSYMVEMRESYARRRPVWNRLMTWDRVVLLCFCTSPIHCHRHVLAQQILPKLGASFMGEL